MRPRVLIAALLLCAASIGVLPDVVLADEAKSTIQDFLNLVDGDSNQQARALRDIERGWQAGDASLLMEALRYTRDRTRRRAIYGLLGRTTQQSFGMRRNDWYRWIWSQPMTQRTDYAEYKSRIHSRVDRRFSEYFQNDRPAKIRLDEIRWGGVKRDGIPPLDHPQTLAASEATYLADTDVVFGVVVGNQARAYPKRILAWHEMVKDSLGGQSINGVYCTLCGSMIVYFTEQQGRHFELGTSGFLYRSNKLMYDHNTKSLWSTIRGEPVVGPLVDQGIRLRPHHVVTTTWGKWKATHPKTTVLSVNTGHRRDYREGAAYRDYFATDELMFPVPTQDDRLLNKDSVLIVRLAGTDRALAYATKFLAKRPVFHAESQRTRYVILTDSSGASRVYQAEDQQFERLLSDSELIARDGSKWLVTAGAIASLEEPDRSLPRLPAHRAFWFGWHAAHPDTRLVADDI